MRGPKKKVRQGGQYAKDVASGRDTKLEEKPSTLKIGDGADGLQQAVLLAAELKQLSRDKLRVALKTARLLAGTRHDKSPSHAGSPPAHRVSKTGRTWSGIGVDVVHEKPGAAPLAAADAAWQRAHRVAQGQELALSAIKIGPFA